MKKDFIEYIKNEFNFKDDEIKMFEESLSKKLNKSIRINTSKIEIENFKEIAQKNNWDLNETSLGKNMFYLKTNERLALGNTMQHTAGYFYVQELAASSTPFYLSNDTISSDEFLILDMSASPGGKTTQLSEYYPNSLIIANEIDKQRLKGFFGNIDRMSSLNTICTNYDGRFYKNIPELFDRIILDAPCSGEGTSYKTGETALKYWNIKNIRVIAKLQYGLLESAIKTLKVGGEMTYSTCTLNAIENEGVVNKIMKKYGEHLEIIPLGNNESPFKKNWPHIDETGGFFVAKIKKTSSISSNTEIKEISQNIEKLSNTEEKSIINFFQDNFGFCIKKYYLYKYNNNIHLGNKNLNNIWNKLFLFKIGVNIGEIKNNSFMPNYYAGIFKQFRKNIININEKELDLLYKGEELNSIENPGYYQIIYKGLLGGIGKIKNGKLKSLINTGLIRK